MGAGLAVAGLAIAGCGGGSASTAARTATSAPTAGAAKARVLRLSAPADGSLRFNRRRLVTRHGRITIRFANPSSMPHAVEVEGHGVEKRSRIITRGTTSLTVRLKKGRYEFYCPVGDHKQEGMRGVLIVR